MNIKRRQLDGLFAHLWEMNRNTSEHKEIEIYSYCYKDLLMNIKWELSIL